MKIAIILGPFSIGTRPLDFWFNNIYESSRGLTGTDLSFCELSKSLHHLGHEVHMFTVHAQPEHKPTHWEGIPIYSIEKRFDVVDDTFDGIISINEPDVFRGMVTKPLRICWNFLNDFTYCLPGFETFVDRWVGVCNKHTAHLQGQIPEPEKWSTVALGCCPEKYTDSRIPGRVVWCSSADRGLHWLLQEWPKIKIAVPNATLKIFYHFNYGTIANIEEGQNEHPHVVEMAQRIRYMKEAIGRLKNLGVEHVGSVSRNTMDKEMSEASVFGFSCDTVAFTEGFSVATLEAHASYTVPVITDKDCLESIYCKSGALIVKSPVKNHIDDFTNNIVHALTDKKFSDAVIEKCRSFAAGHTWNIAATSMAQLIETYHK